MNFTSLKNALVDTAKAVAGSDAYKQAVDYTKDVAYKAGDVVHQVAVSATDSLAATAGVKMLMNYEIERVQIGSAGPGLAWKIFPAKSTRLAAIPGQSPAVSVWILDKNQLRDSHKDKGNTRGLDEYIALIKKDIHNLARLKHPCVLKTLETLEETRGQLILVTEAVWGSAHNILAGQRDLPEVVPERHRVGKLSELEVKFGMLQLAEGLAFLGNEAGMVHRGISPETVMVTNDGSFRISGLAWALSLKDWDDNTPWRFNYGDGGSNWWQKALRPPLNYVAPEILDPAGSANAERGLANRPTPAADIYALAALMYSFIVGRELLQANDDDESYWSKAKSLGTLDLSALPVLLQQTMKGMVSLQPHARPQALTIAQSPFFTEDVLIRALKFLDSMVQRSDMEKVGFLKDLATFWERFDERALTNKVMPPLLGELRTEGLAGTVVPLVLSIVRKQKKQDFQATTLPALIPLITSANGETMMHLLRGADTLLGRMSRAEIDSSIVPLICRALDSGVTVIQEEALKRAAKLADEMEFKLLKTEILPRLHSLCLRTTSGGVRVHSLVLMAQATKRLDKDEATKLLDTVSKVTTVDKTPATVMNTLAVARAVSKQWGADLTATHVLPLLCRLLVANHSAQNFATFIKAIRDMLAEIEEKKGPGAAATAQGASARISSPAGAAAGGAGGAGAGTTDAYSSWKSTSSSSSFTPQQPGGPSSASITAVKPQQAASPSISASAALPSWQPMSSGTAGAPAPDAASKEDDLSWLRPSGSGLGASRRSAAASGGPHQKATSQTAATSAATTAKAQVAAAPALIRPPPPGPSAAPMGGAWQNQAVPSSDPFAASAVSAAPSMGGVSAIPVDLFSPESLSSATRHGSGGFGGSMSTQHMGGMGSSYGMMPQQPPPATRGMGSMGMGSLMNTGGIGSMASGSSVNAAGMGSMGMGGSVMAPSGAQAPPGAIDPFATLGGGPAMSTSMRGPQQQQQKQDPFAAFMSSNPPQQQKQSGAGGSLI